MALEAGARLVRLASEALALQSFVRSTFFLVGPTAVGKSSLAVDVAEELGAEIVNADAFQIYRGLDILTAKPNADARERVPHHLLSAVELNEPMSAAKFRRLALKALEGILARGKSAIVASGSGLYVKALMHGFDIAAAPNPKLRAELNAISPEELAGRLLRLDPELAARTDLKNPRRVIRAIEIAEGRAGHTTVVAAVCPQRQRLGEESRKSLPPRKAAATTGDSRGVFLIRDRDDLYARINQRVLTMFGAGVEHEVATLPNMESTAAQALGLREIRQLLAGEISRDDCIAKIQQATRRYAKRQLTWFRHQTNFPQLNLTALSHQEAISATMRILAQE
jgi:tRNA dimethylallyltransferase